MPWTAGFDAFFPGEVEKRVAEKTNCRIQWNKAYTTVAKPAEELDAIANGLLDVGTIVVSYEAAKLPLQNFSY